MHTSELTKAIMLELQTLNKRIDQLEEENEALREKSESADRLMQAMKDSIAGV